MENFNRQQKRQMKRMGAMTAEGAPARTPPAPRPKREARTTLPQFLREVRAELRKVAWPTRPEVRSYSILVLVTVVVFTTAITVLDYLFGTGALWLFDR